VLRQFLEENFSKEDEPLSDKIAREWRIHWLFYWFWYTDGA
jgi:hypothetical protein